MSTVFQARGEASTRLSSLVQRPHISFIFESPIALIMMQYSVNVCWMNKGMDGWINNFCFCYRTYKCTAWKLATTCKIWVRSEFRLPTQYFLNRSNILKLGGFLLKKQIPGFYHKNLNIWQYQACTSAWQRSRWGAAATVKQAICSQGDTTTAFPLPLWHQGQLSVNMDYCLNCCLQIFHCILASKKGKNTDGRRGPSISCRLERTYFFANVKTVPLGV